MSHLCLVVRGEEVVRDVFRKDVNQQLVVVLMQLLDLRHFASVLHGTQEV